MIRLLLIAVLVGLSAPGALGASVRLRCEPVPGGRLNAMNFASFDLMLDAASASITNAVLAPGLRARAKESLAYYESDKPIAGGITAAKRQATVRALRALLGKPAAMSGVSVPYAKPPRPPRVRYPLTRLSFGKEAFMWLSDRLGVITLIVPIEHGQPVHGALRLEYGDATGLPATEHFACK